MPPGEAALTAVEGFWASTAFQPSVGEVDSIDVVPIGEQRNPAFG
jgi:hypothetical protein